MAAPEASSSAAGMTSVTEKDLLQDIFGDSDSELSDEDEDKDSSEKNEAAKKTPAAQVDFPSSESEQEDDESASEDSADADKDYGALPSKAGKAYEPQADSDEDDPELDANGNPVLAKSTSFIPNDQQKAPRKKSVKVKKDKAASAAGGEKKKRRKKERVSGDEAEGSGGEVKEKKSRKRVERRGSDEPTGEDQAEEVLDEATLRRRMIDAKIEAIGKSSKRKRTRKKEDSEDLGADEIVTNVQAEMQRAVEKDIDQNDARQPAIYKTQLLPKVLKTLQNVTYQQAIMDTSDFLGALRQFLEPLPDGSLPSLSIQRALLEQLNKMEFSEEMLRESKLGRIVNFYARCKRALPEINRQANHLIDKWSRPMLNHHDGRGGAQQQGGDGSLPSGPEGNGGSGESDLDAEDGSRIRQKKRQRTYLAQVVRERQLREEEDEKAASKTTRIPNTFGHAYSVAPAASRPSKSSSEMASEDARQRQQERINNFKKKALKAGAR